MASQHETVLRPSQAKTFPSGHPWVGGEGLAPLAKYKLELSRRLCPHPPHSRPLSLSTQSVLARNSLSSKTLALLLEDLRLFSKICSSEYFVPGAYITPGSPFLPFLRRIFLLWVLWFWLQDFSEPLICKFLRLGEEGCRKLCTCLPWWVFLHFLLPRVILLSCWSRKRLGCEHGSPGPSWEVWFSRQPSHLLPKAL